MRIQLYDRGSPQGQKLFADIKQICSRLQIIDDPEYIKDMYRPQSQGIQGKTILMINNEVVFVDRYPNSSELEAIIQDYLGETNY